VQDQLSADLLLWAALTARLQAHPALRSNALQDAVREVVDRAGRLFSNMEAAQVRLLITLLRVQEVFRTMLAWGLPAETVRVLRSQVVAEVGLPPLFAELLPARLFPAKVMMALAAAVYLQQPDLVFWWRGFSSVAPRCGREGRVAALARRDRPSRRAAPTFPQCLRGLFRDSPRRPTRSAAGPARGSGA
jgi:hypothetical protein